MVMIMSDEATVAAEEELVDDVNQKAESQTTESADEAPEITAQETESDKEEKRQAKLDKRFAKLTKNTYKAEARAEAAEARALAAERRLNPSEDSPDSDEDDIEALIDRKVAEREQQAKDDAFSKKSKALLDKACDEGDFDVDDFIGLPAGAANAIVEMDNHKVLIHLQENPEEIEKLEGMSDFRQAVEIGKLEAKLSAPASVKKSKAPEPITTIGGKKSSGVSYTENMSDTDYDKWLSQQHADAKG